MKKLVIAAFRGENYTDPEDALSIYISKHEIKREDIQQIYADKYCHFLAYWIKETKE